MICSIEWKKTGIKITPHMLKDISLTQDGIPAGRWNLSASLLDIDI